MFKKYGLVRQLFSESHCYENGGDRWRIWVGNIGRWNEQESGGRFGGQLSAEISFGDHIGDFDQDGKHYLTSFTSILLWRYGISLSLRGRKIDPSKWDIPRWKLDKHGELLEEWR